MESERDQVKDAVRAFGDALTDDFLEILDEIVAERRLSRTPDLLDSPGRSMCRLGSAAHPGTRCADLFAPSARTHPRGRSVDS